MRARVVRPCFNAFREARDLPASVRGPVARSHGFCARARAACRARRSGVQPFVGFAHGKRFITLTIPSFVHSVFAKIFRRADISSGSTS